MLASNEKDAITNLLAALDTAQLTRKSVLDAVNPHRAILGLGPSAGARRQHVAERWADRDHHRGPGRVPKTQANADLGWLREALQALKADAFKQACSTAHTNAAELGKETASPACRAKRFCSRHWTSTMERLARSATGHSSPMSSRINSLQRSPTSTM
ncbi:hypothetical protein [Bradyrhizobium sp. DASA03007]|uniref:hypothetical protein n=1 Tax=unclassified Bradyrhizobium TaxID=2631580 RepID=UPI003F6FFCBE